MRLTTIARGLDARYLLVVASALVLGACSANVTAPTPPPASTLSPAGPAQSGYVVAERPVRSTKGP